MPTLYRSLRWPVRAARPAFSETEFDEGGQYSYCSVRQTRIWCLRTLRFLKGP